jgi:hypothetical protein
MIPLSIIEFRLRGINFRTLESLPNVYTEERGFIDVLRLFKRIEVNLSSFAGRLFVYDQKENDINSLVISISLIRTLSWLITKKMRKKLCRTLLK